MYLCSSLLLIGQLVVLVPYRPVIHFRLFAKAAYQHPFSKLLKKLSKKKKK